MKKCILDDTCLHKVFDALSLNQTVESKMPLPSEAILHYELVLSDKFIFICVEKNFLKNSS
ncbi:hypothetical protein HNQ69_001584 [Bartonella callosciuri]|uniref:Uncharacterized protein n=1 Tax=Bartonella callosciuri TaxID=686223 RepID=A0A840NYK5_9HYPH|nr:hypothetical protein [Bartonella callosciuri]